MRKYLSLIGVLLVLVGFHLMPNAEAQVVELDSGLLYASPALLLGINFDFGGGGELEFYPSLSAQVTAGYAAFFEGPIPMVGTTLGYQLSSGHPNNLYVDFQACIAPLAGAGLGWAWQPSTKVSSFRGKLFWPSPIGLGIEYDSRKRLKPYLYAAPVSALLFMDFLGVSSDWAGGF